MDKELLLLPPYLQTLDYASFPQIRELAHRAITKTPEAIQYDSIWSPWRGIFDYVCCVEHAREMLKSLPTGHAIGSVDVVPARYHSASLVFFAQATLDNLAVWTSGRLKFDVKGSDCAFHKSSFAQALSARVPAVAGSIKAHEPLVAKIEVYRQEWIHRLTGGAQIYADKFPSEPDAKIQIMVPINPSIAQPWQNTKAYVKAVARTRTNNGGKWLYPVVEFADELTDGLKALLLAFLDAALAEPLFAVA